MKHTKILIVEDEVVISLALQESLINLGYHEIEAAHNEQSASELLKKNKYDLVLMDVI